MMLLFGLMNFDLMLSCGFFDDTLCDLMAYTLSGVCHLQFTLGAAAHML
jgi:hypothetical protein